MGYLSLIGSVKVQIVTMQKNRAVLDAKTCLSSKVDGRSSLSNRIELNLNPQLIVIWGIPRKMISYLSLVLYPSVSILHPKGS